MPNFLSERLRRFSRSSFKTEKSSDPSETSNSTQSTSTVDTPPPDPSDTSNNARLPTANGSYSKRPLVNPMSSSQRYSINGSQITLASAAITPNRQPVPTSPFAPRVLSVSDNSWVHQKLLLIYGQIADPIQTPMDGQVWVCHHQDSFAATAWPVSDSHFKAVVHLQPGPNRLRLDFVSPKAPTGSSSPAHSSWININYLPLNCSPPLELVLLLAKDSPGTFDTVPERKGSEGNGIDTAIKKFKMAAYIWEAFTGEQMNRNGFGRRCFRFEEEWQQGTLSSRDATSGQMRNEAKIHVIRCNKTLSELRDVDLAQQNKKAQRAGDLFSIAGDAVREHLNILPGQTRYVTVMLLDAHWDPDLQLIRAHAALGGGGDGLQLAVFGSQALHSYPSSLEDLVPSFTDCTRTDTAYVANDCQESGSSWEAANIGIGAHMHEVGHLFGCPHQESGVMLRDYTMLNRTFVCREPYSTRTGRPGTLCLPADECTWHRLDALRFRFHPCFRLPADAAPNSDNSVQVWPVDNGSVMITAATGVAWIEIRAEGDDACKAFLEYVDLSFGRPPPNTVMVNEAELRNRLPSQLHKTKKLRLDIFSAGLGKHEVDDFSQLVSKASHIKLPGGKTGFKSSQLGFSQQHESKPEELLLWYAMDASNLLTSVKIYHGFALDGVEFCYVDKRSQLIGKRGGTPGGSEFVLDTRRGESILGFYLRAGLWIDGIQIITTLGRKSPVYGNANGGSGHNLIPPRGYSLAGVAGSCGQWMDGFSIIIAR